MRIVDQTRKYDAMSIDGSRPIGADHRDHRFSKRQLDSQMSWANDLHCIDSFHPGMLHKSRGEPTTHILVKIRERIRKAGQELHLAHEPFLRHATRGRTVDLRQ
jgi:hypothetical protein